MAEITRPDRSIPPLAEAEILRIENEASRNFTIRRFNDALRYYRQMLQTINQYQREARRPIHKGTPLHMIGLCYAVRNRHDLGLRYFTLAYIEDLLSANYNEEDEADRLPAAKMLRDFYNIRMNVLRRLKEVVCQAKQAGEWGSLHRPETLLRRLQATTEINPNRLTEQLTRVPFTFPPRQPFGFPQPWEQRVFIGGNYQTHMPVIRHIEAIVNNLGYTPIVAFDVEIPRENTHHHTILLLHTCGHAIFEASNAAGQLMEIERTRDFNNRVLLLYSQIAPEAEPSAAVTSMLRTAGFDLRGYGSFEEIEQIVRGFFNQRQA